MVEWHHQLDGHESEQATGVGDGQGSLACCSPLGCKDSDRLSDKLTNNLKRHKANTFERTQAI